MIYTSRIWYPVSSVLVCYWKRVRCVGLTWGQQIRSITVPFSEARGPTNARHRGSHAVPQ